MTACPTVLGVLVGYLMARIFVRIVRREKTRREAELAMRYAEYQQQMEMASNRQRFGWRRRAG
jgi:uncharacterized membrane-anchored protein YhcB (DUF1043 family)